MEYYSPQLIDLADAFKKKQIIHLLFSFMLCILYSILMYMKNKELDSVFLICDALLISTLGIGQCIHILNKGALINKTAFNIVIDGQYIKVTTLPYKQLFLINKPSLEFCFEIKKVRIAYASYNLKAIYDLKNYAVSVGDRKRYAYVLCDFFDQSLDSKLTEIKNR